MDRNEASALLRHFHFLQRRCDLDVLLFFARHPRSMLSSDALAAFLGYDPGEVAASIDLLLGAGLLARQQTPAHAARLFEFASPEPPDDWLSRLVRFGETREGKLALRASLGRRAGRPPAGNKGGRAIADESLQLGPRRLEEAAGPPVRELRRRSGGAS